MKRDVVVELKQLRLNGMAGAWADLLEQSESGGAELGGGTGPQKSLFRKLEALTQNRAEGVPAWLLSHPHVEERIAAIEANEARWVG